MAYTYKQHYRSSISFWLCSGKIICFFIEILSTLFVISSQQMTQQVQESVDFHGFVGIKHSMLAMYRIVLYPMCSWLLPWIFVMMLESKNLFSSITKLLTIPFDLVSILELNLMLDIGSLELVLPLPMTSRISLIKDLSSLIFPLLLIARQ